MSWIKNLFRKRKKTVNFSRLQPQRSSRKGDLWMQTLVDGSVYKVHVYRGRGTWESVKPST